MGKNTLKRSIIVGIIMLFLSTACLPVLASEEKPDLIIEDIVIGPGDSAYEQELSCRVKNIGNTSTPSDKFIDITVTVRWKTFGLLPLIPVRKFTGSIGGSSLASGDTIDIGFAGTDRLPLFWFYQFSCIVNPESTIDELNYSNNVHSETILFFMRLAWFSF